MIDGLGWTRILWDREAEPQEFEDKSTMAAWDHAPVIDGDTIFQLELLPMKDVRWMRVSKRELLTFYDVGGKVLYTYRGFFLADKGQGVNELRRAAGILCRRVARLKVFDADMDPPLVEAWDDVQAALAATRERK